MRPRAIENQVYIIAVNCVGEINQLFYSGNSCVINPNGEVLVELASEESLLELELENNVQIFIEEFPVKRDRKEKYEQII